MTSILSNIVKISILLVLVLGLVYAGSCFYANIKALNGNDYHIPDRSKAKYELIVHNTGMTYYADDIDLDKNIMHGYWQLIDDKYQYFDYDSPPVLSESFGPVTVRKRT